MKQKADRTGTARPGVLALLDNDRVDKAEVRRPVAWSHAMAKSRMETRQLNVCAVAAAALHLAIENGDVQPHSSGADDLYQSVCASLGHPVSYAGKWEYVTVSMRGDDARVFGTVDGRSFDWRVPVALARAWIGE